jgi:hypothetical protein
MAENIQTDSDSQGPIQPGVGRSDQTSKALHQINPNWVEDGFGVVGPQRQVIPKPEQRPPPMDFTISPLAARSGENPCLPASPPPSGTWIWGSVDGVCQWIDTTTC